MRATVEDMNKNFSELAEEIKKLKQQQQPPIGTVVAYAGKEDSIPDGWLLCDGRAIKRKDYDVLFNNVIGTQYGTGDNVMTFNLPDYRGRFLRGVDGDAGRDPDKDGRTASKPGGNAGNQVGSVQADPIQEHKHQFNDPGHGHNVLIDRPNETPNPAYVSVKGDSADDQRNFTFDDTYKLPKDGVKFFVEKNTTGATVEKVGKDDSERVSSETRPVNVYVNYIIRAR